MISGFLCSAFKAIDLGHRKELSYSPQATDGQKGPERKMQRATTASNRTQGVSQGPNSTTEQDALENQIQQQQPVLVFLPLSLLPLMQVSSVSHFPTHQKPHTRNTK